MNHVFKRKNTVLISLKGKHWEAIIPGNTRSGGFPNFTQNVKERLEKVMHIADRMNICTSMCT